MRFPGILATLLIAGAATTLAAQGSGVAFGGMAIDPASPVEVSADELSVNQSDGSAVFSGNVEISQGDLIMTAGSMRIEYAEAADGGGQEITRLLADGGVTLVTPSEAAEADEAIYSIAEGTVTLNGSVLLVQSINRISGDRMVIDLATGTGRIEGRVRTTIQTGGGN